MRVVLWLPLLCLAFYLIKFALPWITSKALNICEIFVKIGDLKGLDEHIDWKSQKKVAFNIASEASFVYILNGQKLLKNGGSMVPKT